MKCGICRELQRRKQHGNPRKTYKSGKEHTQCYSNDITDKKLLFLHHIYHNTFHIVVAHWWWMNMQDDECTAGAEIDSWVKDISDNVTDEMNQVSYTSKIDSDKQLAGLNDGQNFTTENQTQNNHHRSGMRKRQQVYVWNPPQNL